MPPHSVYVEAFAGSAAILRRKRPARQSFAYELNKKTIWELAKHIPADKFTPWTINAEWRSPKDPLPGCGGIRIGFNEPGTDRTNLEIDACDAFEQLKNKFTASAPFWFLNDPAETLIYLDPPYPDGVRSTPGKIYEFELMAEAEHSDLCDLLLALPCMVMISGYDNELYNRKLKGWRKEQIPTVTRGGPAIETVWLNFSEPVELHDYQYAGFDHRDRWRIEKRRRNWLGQLRSMSAIDRGALIADINELAAEISSQGREQLTIETAKRIKSAKKAETKLKPSATPKAALSPAPDPPLLFE